MINLNLLNEKDIPANLSSGKASVEKINYSGSKKNKLLIIIPLVSFVIYLGILAYYFFVVRAPLADLKDQIRSNKASLVKLTPQAEETVKKEDELKILKVTLNEFESFLFTKNSWAHVLNILSNEVMDEIIFNKMEVAPGFFSKKERTKTGVLKKKVPVIIMTLSLNIPEEFSNKISTYKKKLEHNKELKRVLYKIEDTGLSARKNSYSTSFKLFFIQSSKDYNNG